MTVRNVPAAKSRARSGSHTKKLRTLGMSPVEARAKGGIFRQCDAALDALGARAKRWTIWVPGRIEVLGKHTDYAGGRSLLCAVERGFCARVTPRDDATIRVTDVVRGLVGEFPVRPDCRGSDDWTGYVAAVARRISRNFPMVTKGAEIALGSDLPRASGMSSSSALLIAVFVALAKANDLRSTPDFRDTIVSREELAAYLSCIENGADFRGLAGDTGVGTLGGSQDHTAILASDPGKVARYSWSPLRREGTVPLPKGYCFAIASSGVVAEKTAGAKDSYNRASLAVRHLLRMWNGLTYRNDATLADAARSSADAPDRLRQIARTELTTSFATEYLAARLEQFLLESELIIPAAAHALSESSLGAFGAYVDWSQWGTERLLGNQIPATVFLARSAREIGAAAASAFGAGFGGSVWALVERGDASRFLKSWKQSYRRAFPAHAGGAQFFVTNAGPAAHQW
jgi:galactokinase